MLVGVILILAALIIGFLAGNFRRETVEKLKAIQSILDQKKDKPLPDKEKSTLIDPSDPIQQAEWEMKQQFKELNPDYEE